MHRRSYRRWCFVPFLLFSTLWGVGGAFSKLFGQRQQLSPSSALFSFSRTIAEDESDGAAPSESTTKHLEPTNVPDWKRSLPDPLCSRPFLERIELRTPPRAIASDDDADDDDNVFAHVYVLGTAHVSNLSCEDVHMLLEHVDPDVIFLELCDQRMGAAWKHWNLSQPTNGTTSDSNEASISRQATTEDENDPTFWQQVQHIQQHEGHPFPLAAALATASTLQSELTDDFGVYKGGEFRAAFQYALAKAEQLQNQPYGGRRIIHVVMGDRPSQLTWRRAWESLNWWGWTRLLFFMLGQLFSDDEDMEDEIYSSFESGKLHLDKKLFAGIKENMNSIIESGGIEKDEFANLRQHFPTLVATLTDERDAYMACKLHQAALHFAVQKCLDDDNDGDNFLTMVAVVGAGHVRGVAEWFSDGKLRQPSVEVLRELVQTKSARRRKQKRWWRRLWSRKNKDLQQQHADQSEDTLSEQELFLIDGLTAMRLP